MDSRDAFVDPRKLNVGDFVPKLSHKVQKELQS